MIALQITSMKNFMNHLLVADTFDPFLLEEATVSTALTVTVDGHINKDFYPADERGEDCIPWDLQSWSKIKGLCFDLIKGKHTPLYFKFVLHMQPDKAASMLEKAQVDPGVIRALVLNIREIIKLETRCGEINFKVFVNKLKNLRSQRIVYSDLVENHDYPVLETSVSDYSGIQSALLKHKPLFMHRSKSVVNRDYEDLADEVLQIVEVE